MLLSSRNEAMIGVDCVEEESDVSRLEEGDDGFEIRNGSSKQLSRKEQQESFEIVSFQR